MEGLSWINVKNNFFDERKVYGKVRISIVFFWTLFFQNTGDHHSSNIPESFSVSFIRFKTFNFANKRICFLSFLKSRFKLAFFEFVIICTYCCL